MSTLFLKDDILSFFFSIIPTYLTTRLCSQYFVKEKNTHINALGTYAKQTREVHPTWFNVAHRLRRWPNIEQTLVERSCLLGQRRRAILSIFIDLGLTFTNRKKHVFLLKVYIACVSKNYSDDNWQLPVVSKHCMNTAYVSTETKRLTSPRDFKPMLVECWVSIATNIKSHVWWDLNCCVGNVVYIYGIAHKRWK